MMSRWSAFLVWAMVAATALFWGFKLFAKPLAVPPHTTLASPAGLAPADLSRVLGVDAAPVVATVASPVAAARYQLLGVVTPRARSAAREGLALISVDRKTPRAYRVGMPIDGDTVLQTVHARGVTLGPRGGPAAVVLDLPPPAPAATGMLPPPAGESPGAPMPPGAAPNQFPVVTAPSFQAMPTSPVPPPSGAVQPPAGVPQPPFGAGAATNNPPGNRPAAVR